MKRTVAVAVATAAAVVVLGAPGASAEPPPPEFGRSNMGLCSSFLAQLDVPGAGNVRALVNHLITESPPGTLEVDTPGELYRVRAKQHVNGPAPIECLERPQNP